MRTYLFGILAPITVILFVSLAISQYPGFSLIENWLSDLGVGETSIIFNIGIILGGLFTLIFAIGFRKVSKGSYLLIVGSVALIGVGLFPSSTGIYHFMFAVIFFDFTILSLLITAFYLKNLMRWITIFSVAIAFIGVSLISLKATAEIITGLGFTIWIILISLSKIAAAKKKKKKK